MNTCTYNVVLIYTTIKKLKPCGTNFPPIYYSLSFQRCKVSVQKRINPFWVGLQGIATILNCFKQILLCNHIDVLFILFEFQSTQNKLYSIRLCSFSTGSISNPTFPLCSAECEVVVLLDGFVWIH